jgi:hypothetical protein
VFPLREKTLRTARLVVVCLSAIGYQLSRPRRGRAICYWLMDFHSDFKLLKCREATLVALVQQFSSENCPSPALGPVYLNNPRCDRSGWRYRISSMTALW